MKKMLFILGEEIAQLTGLQVTVCRGVMRLAAEKACGSNDPMAIEAHIEKLGLAGWQNLLGDAELGQRLANMGVKNVPAVIKRAGQILVERQSLFTLAAR